MQYFHGEYKYSLNSEDILDPDLPLSKSRAHGGTMILWKANLDPYITVHPVRSTAFLPVIFSPPNGPPSIHVAIYLPTHGKDISFVEDLSALVVCLDDLCDKLPDAAIYLRVLHLYGFPIREGLSRV